jgi:hypothetical protein
MAEIKEKDIEDTTILLDKVFSSEQFVADLKKAEEIISQKVMRCKYCGSIADIDNKFRNVECCVKCHKAGRDRS